MKPNRRKLFALVLAVMLLMQLVPTSVAIAGPRDGKDVTGSLNAGFAGGGHGANPRANKTGYMNIVKIWDGGLDDKENIKDITFDLYKKDTKGKKDLVATAKLSRGKQGNTTWRGKTTTQILLTDKNGNDIEYEIVEKKIEGWSCVAVREEHDLITVTNYREQKDVTIKFEAVPKAGGTIQIGKQYSDTHSITFGNKDNRTIKAEAIASPGYEFVGWSTDSNDPSRGHATGDKILTRNKGREDWKDATYYAHFKLSNRTITFKVDSTRKSRGTLKYNHENRENWEFTIGATLDKSYTVTAVPESGYKFSHWRLTSYLNETTSTKDPTITVSRSKKDHLWHNATYIAEFVPVELIRVEFTARSGGRIVEPNGDFYEWDKDEHRAPKINAVAVPDKGFEFSHWTVGEPNGPKVFADHNRLAPAKHTFPTPHGQKVTKYYAHFVKAPTITFVVEPQGSGTLSGRGWDRGTKLEYTSPWENSYNVTAIPKDGYVFVGWKISGPGNDVSGKDEETITVKPGMKGWRSATYTAVFERIKRELTVKKEITSGAGPYKPGDTVEFSVTIENTGNVDLNGIKLKDAMDNPSGKVYPDRTINLKVAKSETVTYSYTVQEEDYGATITNTASAFHRGNKWGGADKLGEDSATFTVVNKPYVPSPVLPAQTANYRIAHYRQNLSGGYAHVLGMDVERSGTVGSTVRVGTGDIGSFEGYTHNGTFASGVVTSSPELVLGVYYTLSSYTLTVRHLFEDGSQAAADQTFALRYGEAYNVPAVNVEGYTPNVASVYGPMPASDLTRIITYSAARNLDGDEDDTDDEDDDDDADTRTAAASVKTAETTILDADTPLGSVASGNIGDCCE